MKVLTCSLPGFSGKETHSIQEMLKRPPVVAETKVFLLTKIRYVRVSHFWNVFFFFISISKVLTYSGKFQLYALSLILKTKY